MKRLLILTLLPSIFIVISCNKNLDYAQLDDEIILQYISDNNLNAEPTGSGLYYVVNNTGNGDIPDINSIVTVAYKGTLADGTIFDQSGASGATFPLANVIQGWQEGIPLFSEGGSGILIIPSALGYGSQGVGSIPANSVLIFEVTLLNVD
jgi:FKBP-type peptidyl-prolyl cis-trans isomerase FkpA|tara:strand:- start:3810 stop:4262 length:453 start_codon:yes stop_codon:yes gene_type:complete